MGRRLYVGNLPYTTGEAELQELFSRAGTVESVRVMRDAATGRARGAGRKRGGAEPPSARERGWGPASIRKTMKNWTKGDRVVQPTYGPGTLVEVNEHHTVIDFDEHGRRVFATRLVTLQATNEPAPARAAREPDTKTKQTQENENAETS